MKFDPYYLIWSILLFLIEVYIAVHVRDAFVRPYVGDFLVVILIYSVIRSFFKFSMLTTAVGVLLFSFLVEILQYFEIVEILGLGSSSLARVIIGTTFVWEDLVAYSLGIATVLGAEKVIGPMLRNERSEQS